MNNPYFPTREYAGIIFDCDGTLTDSMPFHYLAWQETMNRYGIHFPEDRFYSLAGMPTYRIISLLAGEQSVELDVPVVAREKEQAFLKNIGRMKPIEGVVAVARHFRGIIPIAVASGGYRDVILKQLEQIGCSGLFDVIVTAEDTTKHKPDPEVFLTAAARMAVPASRCLVYEDADLGVQAAAAAGMDCIDIRMVAAG